MLTEWAAQCRKQGGIVVIHMIPEDAARTAVAAPVVRPVSAAQPALGDDLDGCPRSVRVLLIEGALIYRPVEQVHRELAWI